MENLNFGQALEALKQGKKVTRAEWSNNVWLRLVKNGCPSEKGNAGHVDWNDDVAWAIDSFIAMKNEKDMFFPSKLLDEDLLAEDWKIIKN